MKIIEDPHLKNCTKVVNKGNEVEEKNLPRSLPQISLKRISESIIGKKRSYRFGKN